MLTKDQKKILNEVKIATARINHLAQVLLGVNEQIIKTSKQIELAMKKLKEMEKTQ